MEETVCMLDGFVWQHVALLAILSDKTKDKSSKTNRKDHTGYPSDSPAQLNHEAVRSCWLNSAQSALSDCGLKL